MMHVVVCDPPSALREVLVRRLGAVPGVTQVHVVDDAPALQVRLAQHQPDVVLLSSHLPHVRPSGAVRSVRDLAPASRILLLTMGTDPDDVISGMAAGAVGYLARDAVLPEIAAALAMAPGPDPRALRVPAQSARDPLEGLTDRELQVLEGMSRGRSNSEIGDDLFLSEDTIKTHARRLFRKMRVRDRAHAVAEGFRRGLLQ